MADKTERFVSATELEEMMTIAKDIKKEFEYSKVEGKWAWFDRGEQPTECRFDTFLAALEDAVEPYMGNEED